MPSGDIYTIDTHNGYMPAEYMQEERTPNKRKQSDLMTSGGLNRFMASQ